MTDFTGVVPPKKGIADVQPKAPVGETKPEAVADGKASEPAKTQSTPETAVVRPAGNISINVTYPKDGAPESTASAKPMEPAAPVLPQYSAVKLPEGAGAVGDPILFSPGSAKLTPEGRETIRKAAAMLKTSDGTQLAHVFLVGRADSSLDEKFNKELSGDRANMVRAALLAEDITVQQTYPIGENLAPDKASASERARHRFVQLYVLRDKAVKGVAQASVPQ